VGDKGGNRVGFWRASLRFFSGRLLVHVPVLGGYYFLADCLCIALLPEKRAMHDLASGCRVLREDVTRPLFNSFYFNMSGGTDASGGTPDRTPDH
jgi:uncharacterized RDD family membrane protein YckC